MSIPERWATARVKWGEQQKHLYVDADYSIGLYVTEEEAQSVAEQHCKTDLTAMVLVFKIDRLVRAKPIAFESIKAD